jgi:small subunit ribosomal protein S9
MADEPTPNSPKPSDEDQAPRAEQAPETTDTGDSTPVEQPSEVVEPVLEPTAPAAETEPVAEEPVEVERVAEAEAVEEVVVEEAVEETVAEAVAEELVEEAVEEAVIEAVVEEAVEEAVIEAVVEEAVEEAIVEEIAAEVVAEAAAEAETVAEAEAEELEEEPTPRVKPSVPGAHLEVDIVPEGADPLAPEQPDDPYAIEEYDEPQGEEESEGGRLSEPISTAAIDLAAGARYKATGKRKTAIARVILRPGTGTYLVNGRKLDEHFPRVTLQRNIRQPLETVGYQERMDVVARLQGGGISAQAGALRHGISRALLEADPNLRGELKRRGFLTRDSRAKERKKAGLKKARKRPQFSKR